jgi:hypothetical protein
MKFWWKVAQRPWASNVIFSVRLSCLVGLLHLEDIALVSFETSMLSPQATVALQNTWYLSSTAALFVCLFVFGATAPPPPNWAGASLFTRFLDYTQRRTTVDRSPLDEWSARRRDLYLKTQTLTTDRQTCPRWESSHQSQDASSRRPTP